MGDEIGGDTPIDPLLPLEDPNNLGHDRFGNPIFKPLAPAPTDPNAVVMSAGEEDPGQTLVTEVSPEEVDKIIEKLTERKLINPYTIEALIVVERDKLNTLMGTLQNIQGGSEKQISVSTVAGMVPEGVPQDIRYTIESFSEVAGRHIAIADKGVLGAVVIMPDGKIVIHYRTH